MRTIKIKEVKAKIFAFKSAANLQSLFLFDFLKFNPSNKLSNVCGNYKNNTKIGIKSVKIATARHIKAYKKNFSFVTVAKSL